MNDRYFSLRTIPGTGRRPRYSVRVQKRVAPLAVTRNRLKRMIAEALRTLAKSHVLRGIPFTISPLGTDIPSGEELRRDILALLKKSGIVSE